ncbi:MAG: hydroxysqualene dehydroxylase HpnE [Fluviibacter sp.]
MTLPGDSRPSVAIIGAGWAGLACALRLASKGFKPVVLESAPEPGGRARRAHIQHQWRDNGQHLMLAGCTALTQLFDEIGITLPRVSFAYTDGRRTLSLAGRPGQTGLLWALLRAHGFSWRERLALMRALFILRRCGWCAPVKQTVMQWLQAQRQPTALIERFWTPLALAILNTPIEQAAMRRLAPVLRDTLGAGGDALAMLQPPTDLSTSIISPWVNRIEFAGGRVLCGQRVSAVERSAQGRLTVRTRLAESQHDACHTFDQVVLAVPPWALPHMALPVDTTPLTDDFGAQPIATVYLGFDADVRLPTPLVQLTGPTDGDARIWAMDRAHCGEPGVIALSLSAEGPWLALNTDALVACCIRNLQTVVGPQVCRWHRVVNVRRATPDATPNACLPPEKRQPMPGLWLCGDWTHPEYPATLEAAVQTGFAVAEKIIRIFSL